MGIHQFTNKENCEPKLSKDDLLSTVANLKHEMNKIKANLKKE
jgi:hypothetical protein